MPTSAAITAWRRATACAALALAACGTPAPTPAPAPAPALAPASSDRPELMPYSEAVAARFPDPPQRLHTPGLAPGRKAYTSAQELHDTLRAIAERPAAGGTRIEHVQAGRSQQGQAIEALHFSRGPGRPVVLLIGQQHGDEPAGAEALLVLAQRLADGDLAAVLAHIDVVVLPRANPDGAQWGTRVALDAVDINRDHLLLRTPEARAVAALAQRWRPAVVVDLHEHTVVGRYLEKFNAVQRHDMLLQYAMTANMPQALTQASDAWFHQPLRAAMARAGFTTEWYYTNPTTPGDLRLAMGGVQPDTGRNVYGLRHAVSILLESRGVGIGRLHLQRRVQSHVVGAASILASAAEHADALAALQREADAEVAARACTGDVVVLAEGTPTRRLLPMLDPDTGADRAVDVAWTSALQLRALRQRARPCGYWLDAGAETAVQRLRDLGLAVQRVAAAAAWPAEAWQVEDLKEGGRPDVRGTIADGMRPIRQARVRIVPQRASVPAGGWYVPLDQPLAHLAVAALEPDSPNSYYTNHVLERLDQALRVTAPPAAGTLR